MSIIIWRVNSVAYQMIVELLGELMDWDEGTEEYADVVDRLKSLPNFPLQMDEWEDTLIVEEVRSPRSGPGGKSLN